MKFKKELMQDLAGTNEGKKINFDDVEYTVMENEICGQRRWVTEYSLIFKVGDKFYSSWYDSGSTEYQDQGPYENDDDEIECAEVEPYEELVIKYRVVK